MARALERPISSRALERPISFGRSSHVRTYWLLHSEGFRVRGRRLRGTVEAVHGPPSEARALVVRHGVLGRRIVLPADAVERVVPAEELLVVESVRRPGGGRRRSLDHALRAAAGGRERAVAVSRATSRSVVVGGRAVASAARATGRATAPRVRRGALLVAALAIVLHPNRRSARRDGGAPAARLDPEPGAGAGRGAADPPRPVRRPARRAAPPLLRGGLGDIAAVPLGARLRRARFRQCLLAPRV